MLVRDFGGWLGVSYTAVGSLPWIVGGGMGKSGVAREKKGRMKKRGCMVGVGWFWEVGCGLVGMVSQMLVLRLRGGICGSD